MSSQDEVNEIVQVLKQAVSSAIGEKPSERVTVEIKELTKMGNLFIISAIFKITPLLGGRTGKLYVTLSKSDQVFSITNLKIDEKGL